VSAQLGTVTIDGDRRAVRFERAYDATPEELWGALTLPEQLARWLAPAEFEPRVGGRIVLRFSEDELMHGTVREFDPPRLLEYSWHEGRDESVVRFELAVANGGTLLVLEHRSIPVDEVVGFGAGWHSHLDGLELALDGRAHDWDGRFAELKPLYQARLP
jgi:uncharacterized protein YndB with AHSA1/START domain